MSIIQAIVLGVVQGLTEFIPISSSAHLVLVPWLFGWDDLVADSSVKQTFDVALHAGTFFSALIYFRKEVVDLIRSFVRTIGTRKIATFEDKLVWLLVVASIPAAVFGAIGEDIIANVFTEPYVIAITLAVFGLLMLIVDRLAVKTRRFEDVQVRDAVFIGVAQAIALIPGTSRSGVTLTAGIFRGLTREAAVRFSFLMSLPVIGGAALYKGYGLISDGFPDAIGPPQFIIGIAVSFATGYAAIAWLLRFLRTGTLTPFVIYRLVLSAAVFVLISTGLRAALT